MPHLLKHHPMHNRTDYSIDRNRCYKLKTGYDPWVRQIVRDRNSALAVD